MNDGRIGAVLWAIGLVVTGALLLLFNFGFLGRFEPLAQYMVAGCFAAAGIGFFGGYLSKRSMWWRLMPGWTLLSVAVMVLLSTVPAVSPLFIPAVLFIGLTLAFASIYVVNRRANWWAIIPGGFLFVLSLVIGLNSVTDNLEILFAILLIGLGLVFLLLTVLGPAEVKWWPLIPGLVLVLFGIFIMASGSTTERALLRWWPLLLIAIGLGVGWQSSARGAGTGKLAVNVAPGAADAGRRVTTQETESDRTGTGVLGEYTEPAPGASVEIISEPDAD